MTREIQTILNTPEARMSYMNLYKTKKNLKGEERYSVTLLFPKDTDLSEIKNALRHIINEEKDKKFKGIPTEDIYLCLQDGDKYYAKKPEKREAYRGMFYINCSKDPSYGVPTVLDENGLPCDNPSVFDSGDFGIARVNFWAYSIGDPGIACTILGVKKTRSGERFGGGESSDATTAALGGLATPAAEDDILG